MRSIWQDQETNYLTIGPVSKALHLLVSWVAGDQQGLQAHIHRVPAYLWVAEDPRRVAVHGDARTA